MIHCLHGAVGNPLDWQAFITSLDTPAQALNLWDYLPQSLSETGAQIAKQANPGDILLGYSMGGRLALHALLADPEKWRAAIIISAHPGLISDHQSRLAHDQKWADLAEQDWPQFLQKWNQQGILDQKPLGLLQATAQDQIPVSQSFHSWSLGAQNNLRPKLAQITTPILWITGENDQKFTTIAREITPTIPSSTHLTIPNCGHRVPWEAPQKFLHSVQSFLRKLKPL